MQQDLQNNNPYKFEKEKEQKLIYIVSAFIVYRPDIGYVHGLLHLASVLLANLEEYDAFNALINLTHSYHFLPCF